MALALTHQPHAWVKLQSVYPHWGESQSVYPLGGVTISLPIYTDTEGGGGGGGSQSVCLDTQTQHWRGRGGDTHSQQTLTGNSMGG